MSLSIYGRDLFTIYPKSNVYGDPSLVRGPGYREQNFVSGSVGPQSTTNNSTGGSSDDSALPGTTQFGFSISAKF
jgi:hypothetical protein